jgi:penicillin-binding protein 1C
MGQWLVGVWLGDFTGRANTHLLGRELAGPLLFDLLDAIAVEHPLVEVSNKPPPTLKRIDICPISGLPVSPWCPHGKQGWIIPGVSPLKTCTLHRQIEINPATGLRACPNDMGNKSQTQVAEFWDSDELVEFGAAGLKHQEPPAFERACASQAISNPAGNVPQIVKPKPTVSYPLRAGQEQGIELSAIAAGGRQPLFWFVDDDYVGTGDTVFWHGRPGEFTVTVVDAQGESTSTHLSVALE